LPNAAWRGGKAFQKKILAKASKMHKFLPFKKLQQPKFMNPKDSEKECPKPVPGQFCWNELLATDVDAAKKFYASLFGWTYEPFKGDAAYTILKKGDAMTGGMMKCLIPDMPAHWLPYILVEDVDATVFKAQKSGGQVAVEAKNIPAVGRIAVILDPQGAALGIIKPSMESM
jgi:predicted enzyme related to lactoylglutathione lyase